MPDIQLTRQEEKGALPPVCMCCGQPATDWVERTFLLRDPAVAGPSGFLEVYLVRLAIAAANAPRLNLRTSFCSQHRHYWLTRTAVFFGGLVGFLSILVGGLATVIFLIAVMKVDSPALSCCVIVPLFAVLIPWAIATKILASGTIRTRLNEADEVVLQNVDERYIAAVNAARERPA